jgi:shikimate kinase / 3-dehydroquinate synthase
MNPQSSGHNASTTYTHAGIAEKAIEAPVVSPGNIVLAGPPGSGKSTLGRALAEKLSRPFLSTDDEIIQQAGMSIEEIFTQHGETCFRDMEEQVCRQAAARTGSIIACGGGALLNESSRAALEACGVVLMLHCETEDLLLRLQEGGRPLLGSDPAQTLPALLEKRKEHYNSFSNTVDVSGLDLEEAVQAVLNTVKQSSLFKTEVRPDPPSRLILGAGVMEILDQQLGELCLEPPFVVIADSNTGPLYGEPLANQLGGTYIEFPAGEKHKTLDTLRNVYNKLYENRMERMGTIMAVGGGVVGDLAGFAAATYLRGVRWVNISTSLLAMVDSSLGGKVAVDLPYGKNLVGAFYPPALILSDTDALNTLPDVEFRCGMAELIKTAIIGDPLLFNSLEKEVSPSIKWIERAIQVKSRIVEKDPLEKGERASLNLGHTLGHAVESASDFTLRHGEAVAVGLLLESRIAERLGLAGQGLSKKIEKILQRWNLPVAFKAASPEKIVENMKADKKNVNQQPAFALPIRPGKVKIGIQVPQQLVLDTLAEMQEIV